MTTTNQMIFAPCLIALALLAGCQNTQKAEDKPVTTAPASKTAPATKVVMTPVEVESSKGSESKAATAESDKEDSSKDRSSDAESMPISSPSSEYTADRLKDMEKGLRRLQSLPSGKSEKTGSSRGKLDL